MPKRDYHLPPEAHAVVLHGMIHDPRLAVRLGCQALLSLHDGVSPAAAAHRCGVDRRTIYRWHDRYLARQAIDDLEHSKPSGRPRKATPAYIAELEQALAQTPAAYGYDFALWTVERLIAHLAERTAIILSPRTLETLLAELDYVYRRPTPSVAHLQDADAVAQAQANWAALKGGPKDRTTLRAPISSSPWTKPR
jgi:transposase